MTNENNETQDSFVSILKDNESKKILLEICAENKVNPKVLKNLLTWMDENQHRAKRQGLTSEFDDIFTNEQYWK